MNIPDGPNTEAYRRESELERWEILRQMSPEESIAIGEALLTSEILALAVFPTTISR